MSELATGLQGHLYLQCALDDRGLSTLQRQSFRAPFHISKPHRDAGVLVVNVANPTAGFLAGDRAECRIEVESGAHLLLTTPAANRAFRMRAGNMAELHQSFQVAVGASLEFLPEQFIPQAGTRFRQRTVINVAPGGELLFFESLAPGRTASGEVFAYDRLRWETDLTVGERAIARERYSLIPDGAAVRALRTRFAEAYYASCFVVSPTLTNDHSCWRVLESWHAADLWLGVSHLAGGGWVVKILASGPLPLRRALHQVRTHLYQALRRPAPDLRRTIALG